jgi:hypothetical protein
MLYYSKEEHGMVAKGFGMASADLKALVFPPI